MVSLGIDVSVEKRTDVLDKSGLDRRMRKLNQDIEKAAARSAQIATKASLRALKHKRDVAPPRIGRDQEHIADVLRWGRPQSDPKAVALNYNTLNKRARHWPIQEIGTNRSAVVYMDEDTVRTLKIPSQRGRRISSSLVFATGPGGVYSAPGSSRNQQLYLRSKVKGAPIIQRQVRTSDDIAARRVNSLRIRKEIPGQHFVQAGGKAGFREYRKSVLAAARTQFRRGEPG